MMSLRKKPQVFNWLVLLLILCILLAVIPFPYVSAEENNNISFDYAMAQTKHTRRGLSLYLQAQVIDAGGGPVMGATVIVTTPSGEEVELAYNYAYGSYDVEIDIENTDGISGNYAFNASWRALNASEVTKHVSGAVLPMPILNPVDFSSEGVNLSWDAVEGAAGYWCIVFDEDNFTWAWSSKDEADGLIEYTEVIIPYSILEGGKNYSWQLNAFNDNSNFIFDADAFSSAWQGFFTLDDEGPITSNVVAYPNPVAINTPVTLTATVDDTKTGQSNIDSAEYSLDGGLTWTSMDAVDGSFDSPFEEVKANIAPFENPAVIEVCVRGIDLLGNTGKPESIMLAVYDPNGGFVTGGGWIWSPATAYVSAPELEGRAIFGFVSRYQPGAHLPSGNTQFQFRAADLNFRSSDYEWLVTAGHRAQFKGSGTINGAGDYGFMLTAIDGNLTHSQDYDSFRIKIWDKATGDAVYDNQMGKSDTGDNATELGGGSIVIHSGGG